MTGEMPTNNDKHSHLGMMDPDDAPMVMAYRLGQVENLVKEVLGRLDRVADLYINHSSLTLILNPLREKIDELEKGDRAKEQRKSNEISQFRLALAMLILSTIFNIIFVIILGKGV